MRTNAKRLLLTMGLGFSICGVPGLAPTPVAVAADPDIPEPGLYWRSPRPDTLGNMNYAVGARAELHAAPVELARVDRVVYFAGGSVIGQVTNPPYTFDWTVAGNGAVTLRAEARDGAGAVQGWCERTIQVVGEGLQIAQSALAVSVATGATTTVNLDLTNLGPGDTEWAIQIQGGTAPGGTVGAIDRTIANPLLLDVANPLYGPLTYRDFGTVDPSDDEIWIYDYKTMYDFPWPASEYRIQRRAVSNWQDLGVYEDPSHSIRYYCQFGAEGDQYWCKVADVDGAPCLALVNAETKAEIRSIRLDGVPPISWVGSYAVHSEGVVYYPSLEVVGNEKVFTLWQSRSRDGRLIASHGAFPSFKAATMRVGTDFDTQPGFVCWKDGYLWLYGGGNADMTTVKLWRWTPGMDDAEIALSFSPGNTIADQQKGGICPAAEPGFVWVVTKETTSPYVFIRHVDTGMRPWLRLAEPSGTLANGAGRTVSVTIDATTAPTGTYQAVLAITQYPSTLLPQILVPVTLTVTGGGGNQPPTLVSPAWAAPAAVTLPAGTTVHVVASDPEGDPLTYAWSKVSGPGAVTFATPDATDSGVTFSAVGTYVLRVAVSDGRGGSVTGDVSVTVTSDVDARADCNGDGVVNALDLQIVIANFGQTVP